MDLEAHDDSTTDDAMIAAKDSAKRRRKMATIGDLLLLPANVHVDRPRRAKASQRSGRTGSWAAQSGIHRAPLDRRGESLNHLIRLKQERRRDLEA
jgi:hypothetical protein